MPVSLAEAGAFVAAIGGGGFLKYLFDVPIRKRAAKTAEGSANLTAWEKLHDAQAADLADLRGEIRQMRQEHADERIRCASQVATLEAEVAALRATLHNVEGQLHEYKTQGVPIALEEAGRMAVNGFLREIQRMGAEQSWDMPDRRQPKEIPE